MTIWACSHTRSQNVKREITIQPSSSTPGYMPQRTGNRNLNWYCTSRFMAASFTIGERQVKGWLDKQNVVCAYNKILFCLEKERNLTCATTCMNPEDIMLSKISQSQKDRYVWFHLYKVPRVAKLQRQKVEWKCQGLGRGERRKLLFNM